MNLLEYIYEIFLNYLKKSQILVIVKKERVGN